MEITSLGYSGYSRKARSFIGTFPSREPFEIHIYNVNLSPAAQVLRFIRCSSWSTFRGLQVGAGSKLSTAQWIRRALLLPCYGILGSVCVYAYIAGDDQVESSPRVDR